MARRAKAQYAFIKSLTDCDLLLTLCPPCSLCNNRLADVRKTSDAKHLFGGAKGENRSEAAPVEYNYLEIAALPS